MIKYTAQANASARRYFPGAQSDPIFTEENAPVEGFIAMNNLFTAEEYPTPGVHDDNEGFYVVSGEGMIRIGIEEFSLHPGTAVLVPAGVPHAIKRRPGSDLEVFIYHFPK